MFARRFTVSSRVCSLVLLGCVLGAQCEPVWLPGAARLGADALVHGSIAWDPDGAGPLAEALVLGGDFTVIANAIGNRVAMFDPVSGVWSPLGSGFEAGTVSDFCVLPAGDLVAAGFSLTLGPWLGSAARWNGTDWQPLATGLTNPIHRLVSLSSGQIIAAGPQGLWRIDPITDTWVSLVSSWSYGVAAMAVLPDDHVLIAASGGGNSYLFGWDGVALSSFVIGIDGPVRTLDVLGNGDVLAGGDFTSIGGVNATRLARWDGASWQPVAPGLGSLSAAAVMANGDIVVSGFFTTVGGVQANHIARWDGGNWSPLQLGLNARATGLAALPSGDLFATVGWGGGFTAAGGVACNNVAHFDGAAWPPLGGSAPDAQILDFTMLPDGDVVAVGLFDRVGPLLANGVARWHQGTWMPMDQGFTIGAPVAVRVVVNGDVWAGGYNGVQRWNGSSWVATGFGTSGIVGAIAAAANGDVIVGGRFSAAGGTAAENIARWDGSSWKSLGAGLAAGPGSGLDAGVGAVVVMPDGDIIAARKHVYRWDGTAWAQLGSAIGASTSVIGASSLLVLPDGSLLAGGVLSLGSVARWDGVSWSALGSGPNLSTESMTLLPGGDLAVCGRPYGSATSPVLSRWNGVAWTPMPVTVTSVRGTPAGWPQKVELMPNNELGMSGTFNVINHTTSSPYFARLAATCPATADPYGTGCSSSAGPVQMTVDELPWLGGSFRATTTGMPNGSLGVGVGGFLPIALSLPELLPQALPGCDLLATPDALFLLVPTGGQVRSEVAIPALPLYLNKQFYHQVVVFELDAVANIVAVSSSNAVELLVGTF